VASLIDLYPMLLNIAGVEHRYTGFATDLRHEKDPRAYNLAQIHPDPMPSDLILPHREIAPFSHTTGPQWCLFNALTKYTYDEKQLRGWGVQTFSEDPLSLTEADHVQFQDEMKNMINSSQQETSTSDELAPTDALLLDQRLRDLGYLE